MENILINQQQALLDFISQQKNQIQQIQIQNQNLDSHFHQTILQTDVYFPYSPYKGQITYMQSVIKALQNKQNALIQSPTGTGKTLCFLAASLAWLQKERQQNRCQDFKIIYCARTHSQLKQALNQLKKTVYRPTNVVLGSRDKYCINEQVRESGDIDKGCKYAIKGQFGYTCNMKKEENLLYPEHKEELLDIEDLIEISKKDNNCPYYYTKDIQQSVDLILVPYAYLLDRTIANTLMTEIKEGFIIFDEAHNIQKIAEEGFSYEINNNQLQTARNTLDGLLHCGKYLENLDAQDANIDAIQKLILIIDTMLNQLQQIKEKVKDEGQQDDNQQIHIAPLPREKQEAIFDHIFTKKLKDQFLSDLHIDAIDLIVGFIEMLEIEEYSEHGLGSFQHFLKGINSIYQNIEQKKPPTYYMLCLNLQDTNEKFASFKLQNLDPSLSFKNLNKKGNFTFLLTSGTLSPFDSWSSELKLDFPIQTDIGLSKSSKNQILAQIVQRGPKHTVINFTHDIRKNPQSYKKMIRELGNVIFDVQENIPKGILVIFASHGLMINCIDRWTTDGFMMRIQKNKEVFIENKNQENINILFEQYKYHANGKGAILFAVCRGRLIEGIDFHDELSRGVILVGVPNLPPCTYVNMKFQFLEQTESKLQGSDWFQHQTIRFINQSIGRVIRHQDDYGCVILADLRFNKYTESMPKWLEELKDYETFDSFVQHLQQFFQTRIEQGVQDDNQQKQSQSIQQMVFPSLQNKPGSKDNQKQEEQKQMDQYDNYDYNTQDIDNFYPQTNINNPWNQKQIIQNSKNIKNSKGYLDKNNDDNFPDLLGQQKEINDFPSMMSDKNDSNMGLMNEIYKKPVNKQKNQQQVQQEQIIKEQHQNSIEQQVIGKKKKKGKNLVYISGGFQ